MADLECNVDDVALIFEGGGMRASYSSAIAVELLRQDIYFPHVYGVSAGSSNSVNYVSRDIGRTQDSFTRTVTFPQFGGVGSMLAHRGFFNARYLYQEIGEKGGALPFDYETFSRNPADVTICFFERDTGRSIYQSKKDWHNTADLMRAVRASSTLPLVMPPISVDGQVCYDGGLGEDRGMLVSRAARDGFERYFVVRTRPRAYRKPSQSHPWLRAFFWRRPAMRASLAAWSREYNEVCDRLERMEREGSALIVYADEVTAENSTTDYDLLEENFAKGTEQAKRELERWVSFLGL
ncbi:MAG: patatin-like phospholipase family protein [Eggerthellaceae bacterium]|jgi:predicted patatin/cPLA2 family phospholipase